MDWILWLGGSFIEAALFAVLIYRRRWREFPAFTALYGSQGALSILMFLIYKSISNLWYRRIYFSSEILGFILELWIVWDVLRIVMRPTGTWLRDARKQFISGGAVGILLAAALAWMIAPPASNFLESLKARGDLFTDLMFCELLILMLLTAQRLGLGFRNHVFALVLGSSFLSIAAIVVDLLHDYYGDHLDFGTLENMYTLVIFPVVLYWMVQFWKDEPARRELSPDMRAYILALHERVKKDVDRLAEQR